MNTGFALRSTLLAGIAASLFGCSDDLAGRIGVSVADTKDGMCAPRWSPFQRKRGQTILAALQHADRADLSSPTLCDARWWYHGQGKLATLIVYWIENQPTPDSVQLVWKQPNRTKQFRIPNDIAADNRNAAKVGVVYWAAFDFPVGSQVERALAKLPQPSAALLRGGNAVSNELPVTWTWIDKSSTWGDKPSAPGATGGLSSSAEQR
jgi:hypothetical protein